MPQAYIIAQRAISYRRTITRSVRNGYHCKKPELSTGQFRLFTWLPEFCSNQRHKRSEISSHCSACSTSHCSYFFLRRHRLFLPLAAAVSAPVNSLRLFIQNAVSIKMKNQKRNHPNGCFFFVIRVRKRTG